MVRIETASTMSVVHAKNHLFNYKFTNIIYKIMYLSMFNRTFILNKAFSVPSLSIFLEIQYNMRIVEATVNRLGKKSVNAL